MLLKLTYKRATNRHSSVTLLGDPEGIRDLYWQLTHNYKGVDGTAIGDIQISTLDGHVLDVKEFKAAPYTYHTALHTHLD